MFICQNFVTSCQNNINKKKQKSNLPIILTDFSVVLTAFICLKKNNCFESSSSNDQDSFILTVALTQHNIHANSYHNNEITTKTYSQFAQYSHSVTLPLIYLCAVLKLLNNKKKLTIASEMIVIT